MLNSIDPSDQRAGCAESAFSASKAAVRSFARVMSAELLKRRIRVNPVSDKAKAIFEARLKRFDGDFLFHQNDVDGEHRPLKLWTLLIAALSKSSNIIFGFTIAAIRLRQGPWRAEQIL